MPIEKIKLALRITTDAFNGELEDLCAACLADLGIAGVDNTAEKVTVTDPLILQALITYCKLSFGEPEEYDRLKACYDEQKAQLSMASGYTIWNTES